MSDVADEAPAGKPKRQPRTKWTDQMKEDFLDHLAGTCNISAAAAEAGVLLRSIYQLRRTDQTFRDAWAVAVECGYEALETQLVGHALAGGGDTVTNGVAGAGVETRLALALLTEHRNRNAGVRKQGAPPLKRATAEETDAAILRKIAAMKRGRGGWQGGPRKGRQP